MRAVRGAAAAKAGTAAVPGPGGAGAITAELGHIARAALRARDGEEDGQNEQAELGLWDGVCTNMVQLLMTYTPSIISALFMTALPYCLDLLLFVPKIKSRTQRYRLKFTLLLLFLVSIQGLLGLILGAALSDQGVLQLAAIANWSVNGIVAGIGANIGSQSLNFLNYVIGKYFLFSVMSILRLPDVFSTALETLCLRDPLMRSRVNKFASYDYMTHLCYLAHMLAVGLLYSLVQPMTIPIIFAVFCASAFVSRYNILFVCQAFPQVDMSAERDIFTAAAQSIFLGTLLMPTGLLCYVAVNWGGARGAAFAAALAVAIVAVLVLKFNSDSKFAQSVKQLKLGNYEPPALAERSHLRRLLLGSVATTQRASLMFHDYVTTLCNPEGLETHELSARDLDHISCFFTHPSVSFASVYCQQADDLAAN